VVVWLGFSKIGKTKEGHDYIFSCVKDVMKKVVINCSQTPTDGKM